jgi:hypothetical protein
MKLYVPFNVKSTADSVKALLYMTVQHMADFQMMMLEVLEEKYGFTQEEMMESIESHPRYKELMVNPMMAELFAGTEAAAADANSEKKGGGDKEVKGGEEEKEQQEKVLVVKSTDGKKKVVKKKTTVGNKKLTSQPAGV